MNTQKPTIADTAHVNAKENEAPAWYITLAPDILLSAYEYPAGEVRLRYSGWPQDLLAAGIITRAHLRGGKVGRPRSNPAPDGGKISVARRWKVKERTGKPARYFDVKLDRPMTAIAQRPGALAALAARARYEAWRQERYPDAHMALGAHLPGLGFEPYPAGAPIRAPAPALKLVVDNTRVRP